jgi:hypothetical protein
VARLTGLWVYQELGRRPEPEAVAARAQRHGLKWLSAQAIAIKKVEVLDPDWLRAMRRATKKHGLRLGVHGYVGRPHPKPAADARAMAKAIDVADADFAIVDAEVEYRDAGSRAVHDFVAAYRGLKPDFRTFLSSFGRPSLHSGLDWATWAKAGFLGMPQAYENLNAVALKPKQCVDDWARFFHRKDLRPTLGCFSEKGHHHLPIKRLVESVHEVPGLPVNVYHHGTVTAAELEALAKIT